MVALTNRTARVRTRRNARINKVATAILLAIISTELSANAHRLDEYLQATLITIQTNAIHVEVCLTPGVSVAPQLLPHLDLDSNGVISTKEAQSYAEAVSSDLALQLNNRPLPLQIAATRVPEPEELGRGDAIIRLDYSSPLPAFLSGTNSLTFTNTHQPALSVYLLNAAHPLSPTFQIRNQLRNSTQSGGEIAFTYDPPRLSNTTLGWLICGSAFLGGIALSLWLARTSNRPKA